MYTSHYNRYNQYKLIMKETLPSLDGQKDYIRIYDIYQHKHELEGIIIRCNAHDDIQCDDDCMPYHLDSDTCDMSGQTMEVLRYDRDGILAKLQRRFYVVKCDEDGNYHVRVIRTAQHDLKYNEYSITTISALMAAHRPYNDFFGGANFLTNLVVDRIMITHNYSVSDEVARYIRGVKHHGIDREHVDIGFNYTGMSDTALLSAVNSTYVNTVHDCHTLCAQSVLNGSHEFMSEDDFTRRALLCVRAIVGETQDSRVEKIVNETDSSYVKIVNETDSSYVERSAMQVQSQGYNGAGAAAGAITIMLVSSIAAGVFIARSKSQFAQSVRGRIVNAFNVFRGMIRVRRHSYGIDDVENADVQHGVSEDNASESADNATHDDVADMECNADNGNVGAERTSLLGANDNTGADVSAEGGDAANIDS